MRSKNLISFLLCIFLSSSILAQEITITGNVKDETGISVPGANVLEKGTTNGVVTDVNGNYSIKVKDRNASLMFTFIGYKNLEIAVAGKSVIDAQLSLDATQMEEVVVVGYGTQKKANLTGSVSTVKFDDAVNQAVTNTTQLLQGKMSGVQLTQAGGQPGRDGATIRIRGVGTLGDANPMVLVDGVEMTLADVAPSDIESMTVLKDAASSAIYGSRAANGVILITTKSGEKGKMSINYSGYYGIQKATVLPDLLSAYDYAVLMNETLTNQGKTARYSEDALAKILSGDDPDKYADTYWPEELFRTSAVQNHYLSFNGGTEKNKYLVSFNYLDQEGTMIGSASQRYNLRVKVDSKIKNWLNVGINVNGSVKKIEEPLSSMSGDDGLMRRIVFDSPVAPVRFQNGEFAYSDGAEEHYTKNVVAAAQRGENITDQYRMNAKAYAKIDIFKGLSFETTLAYNFYTQLTSKFSPTYERKDADGNDLGGGTINSLKNTNALSNKIVNENILRYSTKLFDVHNINILMGHSIQSYRSDNFNAYVKEFPNNEIHELSAGVTDPLVGGGASEWALQSYFGRINYNYNDKYLLEANIRRDGSSRFKSGSRYGTFPSFSAGWRVSEESFIKNNISLISNLKLRAGWGKLGNQEIGNYPYAQLVALGQDYLFLNEGLSAGAAVTSLANDKIKWETTKSFNVGFDFGALKNKLNVTFDYFKKNSYDVLLRLPIPQTLGNLTAPYQNAGEVMNRGWEATIDYSDKIGEIEFHVGANISKVHNEIVDLKGQEFYPTNRIHREGEAIGSYFGYKVLGVFQTADEVAESPTQSNATAPGDFKYADISGPDGVPDGKISDDDRVVIGNAIPEFNYGLNAGVSYKGIDLNILFQGVQNVDRYVGTTGNHPGSSDRMNWTSEWVNRWTPDKPSNTYPRLGANSSQNTKVSSFYVKDASYLRLKNIEFGYNFPKSLTQKAGIEKFRVYVSGQNLFTITDFENWDPERAGGNVRNEAYPHSKIYTVGVNLTF